MRSRSTKSKYCPNELVAIARSGKPVVPVFYGVEPVDLRWVENDPLAKAFESHKSKRSEKKVQEWREALATVAGITGFRLADYRSDESQLKREVVNQVACLAPSHIPVEVESCRVGLHGPVRSCIQVLEEMGGGIGILGLVGMGGIGKTTLAREIYNYYAGQTKFRHMSFLEIHRDNNAASSSNVEVRPTYSRDLRKQLLWDLLRVETSGSSDYSNWFQKLSTVGPVMIVVDDVHNLDQFKALIPFAAELHSGSRIIVTSRDRSILNNVAGRAGVDRFIFNVALLDPHDSNMMFHSHAFHAKEALEGYRELAKDVVAACGGLPLALKVIGSSLFDKRSGEDKETIWIEAGDAMRRSKGVMDVLRWSYDMLPEEEQRMFVDVTCLFVNKSRDEALMYWRSCRTCVSCTGIVAPHTSLRNLMDKNLVSGGDHACRILKVHDLLVELGQEIGMVTKTHFIKGNIGEAAFLRKKGSTNTRALHFRESKKRKFEIKEFANMTNLHFLELPEGGIMAGDWSNMPKQLRWLRWRNSSLIHVPQDLDLSHLTSLDFSYSSSLVDLWSKSKVNLKGCPNLVWLDLSGCTSITKLSDSTGESSQLQDLNLSGCTRLELLPNSVGQLKQLRYLNLRKCKKLRALPESIVEAAQLRSLELQECMKLERLPESIGMFKQLEDLIIDSCTGLKTLPDSIGDLSSLRVLSTNNCTSLLILPPSIQLCSSLCSLQMEASRDCQIFLAGSVGEAWTVLRFLRLQNSHGLASLLDYGALKSLEELEVKDKTLTEFPESIGLLVTLKKLEIECERLQRLPNSLGNLKRLNTLLLRCCENLKRLPKTLTALTNLDQLVILDCGLLQKLPSSIGMLPRLSNLYIRGCKKIRKLPTSFTQLINLHNFSIINCGSKEAIMEVLTTVQGMPIWGSTSVTKLPPSLGVLSNLHIKRYGRESSWLPKAFDGTCLVLEEDESGFLKAYHDESTGLLSLLRWVYRKVRSVT